MCELCASFVFQSLLQRWGWTFLQQICGCDYPHGSRDPLVVLGSFAVPSIFSSPWFSMIRIYVLTRYTREMIKCFSFIARNLMAYKIYLLCLQMFHPFAYDFCFPSSQQEVWKKEWRCDDWFPKGAIYSNSSSNHKHLCFFLLPLSGSKADNSLCHVYWEE